jgi:hypothetical protein
MSSRFLWVTALSILPLCVARTAGVQTNAVIPFKTLSDLCQIASAVDQSKLLIEVVVSSTNQAVRAEDILLTIQSGSQGRIPVQLGTNGQVLNFPLRKELARENPPVSANQPKGTLRLTARYEIPLRGELTFRYSRLGDAAAETTRMIKAQAGMMSLLAPKSQGRSLSFLKKAPARPRWRFSPKPVARSSSPTTTGW